MLTLIVDDHPLFSHGLRLLLLEAMPTADISCCEHGADALALASRTPFELILLDWNLGSGLSGADLVAGLKSSLPHTRVVIVSGESSADLIRLAIDSGAVGFVPKESSSALLIDALRVTAHGGMYLPRSVLDGDGRPAVPRTSAAAPHGELRDVRHHFPQLTKRHVDILDLLVRGMPNKQIARELDISDGTVKQHLNAIFRELHVDNRTEVVYLLARSGIKFD